MGRILAFTLYPNITNLILDAGAKRQGDGTFRAVKDVVLRELKPATLVSQWPSLMESHFRALSKAAPQVRKPVFWQSHSPGVLENISEWLQRPLPGPEHREAANGLEPVKVKVLLRILRSRYPGWDGFDHPGFAKDEVHYKRETMRKAQEKLSRANLLKLMDEERFDDFIRCLVEIASDNNLLFLRNNLQGDLNILYQPALDKTELCAAVFDLLHGEGDSPERLGRYVAWVKKSDLPSKWTFPTYFLFVCHPESEIFIKPETTKAFLGLLGVPDEIRGDVTAEKYAGVRDIAYALMNALAEYEPEDMVDIQSVFWVCGRAVKKGDKDRDETFRKLFSEFVAEYPNTPQGRKHLELYGQSRKQARAHYEEIRAALDRGEDRTDSILLHLLPHLDSAGNRERGGWIHYAPAVTKDLKSWFEGAGWAKPEDWPQVARDIWELVETCVQHPDRLEAACQEFQRDTAAKGLQTGMLTPILNALRPEDFLLVNKKSRQMLIDLTGQKFGPSISEYPKINQELGLLIEELSPWMEIPGAPPVRASDRFDMFCHWYFTVREKEADEVIEVPEVLVPPSVEPKHAGFKIQISYSLAECALATGFDEETLARWVRAIRRKGQAIFYGPPGTGKTHMALETARHLIGGGDGFCELVQFHPSYSYEEFIQGIRPEPHPGGGLDYPLKKGRFLEFCEKAAARKDTCVLIIDEINRANLSRVFGELMYLLEYRNDAIPLAAGRDFTFPKMCSFWGR